MAAVIETTAVSYLFGGGSTANLVGTAPSGVASGDVLVAIAYTKADRTVSSAPSGWTLVDSQLLGGDFTGTAYVYAKTAGGSEPASYTWVTSTTSTSALVAILRVSGAADIASNAVEADISATAGSSGTVTAPTVTPSDADSLIMRFAINDRVQTGFTPPTGYTESIDSSDATSSLGVTVAYSTGGASATGTASFTYLPTHHTPSGGTLALAPSVVAASGGWVSGLFIGGIYGFGATVVATVDGPGCWVDGDVYLPDFKDGSVYLPDFKDGDVYKPGFYDGENVC